MGGVKKLVKMLNLQLPGHRLAVSLHRKLILADSFIPAVVVESIGYYLVKYQAQILRGDDSFFLKSDFSEDLAESVDLGKRDDTAEMIPLVKECVQKMPEEERLHYASIVQDMLIAYLEYRIETLGGGGSS